MSQRRRGALAAGSTMLLAGCAQAPLSYVVTRGASANAAMHLGWGLGALSLIVIVIIAVLLVGGVFRKRPDANPGGPEGLAVHRAEGGLRWISVGVGISTVALVACAVWTMITIAAIAKPPNTPALTIDVTAHQWWWEARYHGRGGAADQTFTTANELHIPVGVPVRITLSSLDVIHSFWVPKLAGKMDVIPGQTNETWIDADTEGRYRGQCGEYCGAQHAGMALEIVADSAAAFDAWRIDQLHDAATPTSRSTVYGMQVVRGRCGACHTIRGADIGGIVGPDLTHLMTRGMLAAGQIPNDPASLAAWITDSQKIKPGSRMPVLDLSRPDLTAAMDYLETLH